MVESCGCPRHSLDIRVIAVCYQKRRGRADTCRYQGDRWLLSEMISLRYRVNEALCGRNGRQRRVRCHGAASVPHPSRIPQRVASSPAVSCPCRVRVTFRGAASVSYPGTASVSRQRHRVRAASESASRGAAFVSRQRHRVRVASLAPRAVSRRIPTAPSVSPPVARRIPRCRVGRCGAAARSRPQQRSEMPRRRTARATGNIVTPVARQSPPSLLRYQGDRWWRSAACALRAHLRLARDIRVITGSDQ
jgi:hypothetical protein